MFSPVSSIACHTKVPTIVVSGEELSLGEAKKRYLIFLPIVIIYPADLKRVYAYVCVQVSQRFKNNDGGY